MLYTSKSTLYIGARSFTNLIQQTRSPSLYTGLDYTSNSPSYLGDADKATHSSACDMCHNRPVSVPVIPRFLFVGNQKGE